MVGRDGTVRCFSLPLAREEAVGLPAAAGAAGYPHGPAVSLIGSGGGHWNACDVLVSCPNSWADVTFVLVAIHGVVRVEADVRKLADIRHAVRGSGATSGILFSIRDHVADAYQVEAYLTGAAHEDAQFRIETWGCEGLGGQDLASAPVVYPFAPPHRLWLPASTVIPVGAALVLAPANPNGGRAAITALKISTDDAVKQEVTLLSGATVIGGWVVGAGQPGGDSWTFPLWTPPGAALSVQTTAAQSLGSLWRASASGFYE